MRLPVAEPPPGSGRSRRARTTPASQSVVCKDIGHVGPAGAPAPRPTSGRLRLVLEDVEPCVAIAREHVLLAVRMLVHLDAPEVVAALGDVAADLFEPAWAVAKHPEPAGVVRQIREVVVRV